VGGGGGGGGGGGEFLYPLYRMLRGPDSGTRNFGKENSFLCLSGFETRSNNIKYHKAYFAIPIQRICSVIFGSHFILLS